MNTTYEKKFYMLYKTTNMINNKIYIGIHGTNILDDGYLGSGTFIKEAIKKYGKENFVREILSTADNYHELSKIEREIVTEDFCKRRDTYNIEIGGAGGKIWTQEMRDAMSTTQKAAFKNGRIPGMLGKTGVNLWSNEHKQAHSDSVSGKKNGMYGIDVADKMTPENNAIRLKKISKANKGKIRTDEHKKNYSNSAKSRIWLVHISGKISHTIDKNDPRLSAPDWQRGQKWRSQ